MEDGCVMWWSLVVISERERQRVLQELCVGHPGMFRMKGLAIELVW